MEQVLEFVRGYWWLVFPLMGVAGGAAKAWERGARRRHERRLEIIRTKGQIKAAQASARTRPAEGGPTNPLAERVNAAVAAGLGGTGATSGHGSARGSELERLLSAHDAVTARWLEYELDVGKVISFPAMSDGRQPLTAAFLRAKKVADRLRPPSPKARLTHEQLREYREAVTDFEVAFDVAERDARRLKDSGFTTSERKRLDTAKQLLTIAVDEAATPAERQLAYRRVREELDGLLSLSDEAIEVLEKRVSLELPRAASDRREEADAATAPPASGAVPPPTDAATPAASAPGGAPDGRPPRWAVPRRDTTAG